MRHRSDVRSLSALVDHDRQVTDPRLAPDQMLQVGRLFELNGDRIGAVVAYREVVLAGREPHAGEARTRLLRIAEQALSRRPAA